MTESGNGPRADSRFATGSLPRLARYRIVEQLGEGGAGVVYEATDLERGGRVALKMLRAVDGEQVLRLKEEFRSLQDIEHRNLIRLFELVCEGDTWFYTMEVVRGVDFVDYVAKRDIDLETVTRVSRAAGARRLLPLYRGNEVRLRSALLQLCSGLAAIHAAGKTHCDIKPSNVLVDGDGRVVVLDFGLVRDAGRKSVLDAGAVLGTIGYMAPEQATADDVGPAADWYAVGSILYRCLTGRRPFDGDEFAVLRRKVEEDPPPPNTLVAGIHPDLNSLCMDLLARDPARRPTDAEILRRLGSHPDSERHQAFATGAFSSAFVGRGDELAVLDEALEEALGGATVTVVVEGESGVGKSALVRHFTRTVDESIRAVVLSGRCYERERVPFKAVDGVVDTLSDYLCSLSTDECRTLLPDTTFALVRAFPVLGRVVPTELSQGDWLAPAHESRSLLFSALRQILCNIAAKEALVMVIDDLQWADEDSLLLLSEILRPGDSPRMLFAATARPRGAPSGAGARSPFGLPGDVRLLPLRRLTADAGLTLATALAGDLSSAATQRIAEEANGHPLFVHELVRHAQLFGSNSLGKIRLDDALVARVARLDPSTRIVLERLSVAGTAIPQDVLMRASALTFTAFTSHVRVLRAAHLVTTSGARGRDLIEPFHDRIQEAIAARLAEEPRRAYHTEIARSLESEETKDSSALSTQWLGAGHYERAGTYARIAADEALRAFAFDRAAEFYERAFTLGKHSPEAAQDLRVKLADTLATAGRGALAADWYFKAAAFATTDRAIDLRRRAAEELLSAGRMDEGEAAVRDVLRRVGLRYPPRPIFALVGLLFFRTLLLVRGLRFEERAEHEIRPRARTRVDVCNRVGELLSALDTIRGAYFQSRGLLAALELGDSLRLAQALATEGAYVVAGGSRNSARSEKLNSRAGAMAARSADMELQARVESAHGYSLFFQARFPEALACQDHALGTLREYCPAAFWVTRVVQLGGVWAAGWTGDLTAR